MSKEYGTKYEYDYDMMRLRIIKTLKVNFYHLTLTKRSFNSLLMENNVTLVLYLIMRLEF